MRTADNFEVAATVPVIIHDDIEEAAGFLRPVLALYIGGMGAREVNFHANVFGRMGYEAEAREIQDLYLQGKKEEAAALVPMSLIEETALDRAEGEDPRRPRAVARVVRHHDAPLRRRQHPPHHGRARPLTASAPSVGAINRRGRRERHTTAEGRVSGGRR